MSIRRAYAKINLALSVGPPLPVGDPHAGMHPISSWMHAIDLYDEVEITPGRSGWMVEWAEDALRPSLVDWPAEKDLAVRALRLMQEETGRPLGAAITILKRIPAGGGLGGGSADAAAAMLAANDAFGLGVPTDRLRIWSRRIGSDVAFFLDDALPPRAAVVGGLGERLARVPPARGWVVLIAPSFGCPTGAVYRAYDAMSRDLREKDIERMAAARQIDGAPLFNDLRAPAEAVTPELRAFRERAEQATGSQAHLSGSGSTLFICATAEGGARRAESVLRAAMPDVAVRAVRLL